MPGGIRESHIWRTTRISEGQEDGDWGQTGPGEVREARLQKVEWYAKCEGSFYERG